MKNGKRLACDVIYASATHANHNDNVSGTGCQIPNSSTHGHVFMTLKH